jgi:DNA-binding transcriptional ArsR family regulator
VCGDIVNELPLAQPTVSQHLKELKNAGLIKVILKETLFVTALDEEGFNKIRGFSAHNTYLENKKINVVNFKLVENEVIRN